MARRARATLWTLLVLALTLSALPARSIAQDPATPIAGDSAQLLEREGIDAPILSRVTVDPQSIPLPRFLLERLELPRGASLPQHTATSAELLFIEAGTVSIADNFGFTSTASVGDSLTLVAETSYSLSNDGTESVSVLRANLSPGTDTATKDPAAGATPAAFIGATPQVDSATPVVADTATLGTSTLLIDLPVETLPTGESTFFLAQLTLEPGAESGEQAHAGPIALYIDAGSLTVQSPSGLSGQLGQGQAVALPASAPLVAGNQGNEQAHVYIVGVVETSDRLMAEVTPEPAPTPTLEPTPEPTATTVPTPTAEPSPTPEPTSTPEPTAIPTPTPVPTTEAGTILQLGETWRAESATMTVFLEWSETNQIGLRFSYTNLSDSRVDFLPSTGALRIYDDQRNSWEPQNEDLQGLLANRIILEPGETFEVTVRVYQPNGYDPYSANTFVVIEGFGEISYAKWGFTFNNGRVLTIPPDAVDPTEGGGSSAPSDEQTVLAPGDAESGTVASLGALLPTEVNVTEGLVTFEEGGYPADVITSSFLDPSEAASLFQQWGWQENTFRTFVTSTGEPLPNGLVKLEVSAHRFGTPEGAAAALDYICNVRRDMLGIVDGTVELIGDQSRAIGGATPEGVEVSVYVRRGDAVVRITAISAWGDPTADAVAVARYVGNA